MISEKFAGKTSGNLFYVANSPEDAFEYIKTYIEPVNIPSKTEIYSR